MTSIDDSKITPNYEQELNRISELFENTRINYQVLDEAGRLCFVNQPWLKTLGYDKDEILLRPFIQVLNRESGILFQEKFQGCYESIPKSDLELTLRCKDGSEIIACFTCFCNPENEGSSQRYHCTFQNITRLKDTEKALRASEDNYERIFKSFRDVYYQADPESRILLVSPSIETMSGYKPEELVGHSMQNFFASPEVRSEFRAKLFHQGCVDDHDLQLRKKNGEWIDASISAQVIKNKDGEASYVEGVIRDISRRKRYESEIASYNTRLKEVTDNLPVVLFQLNQKNKDFRIVYLTSSVANRIDASRDAIMQNPQIITSFLSNGVSKAIQKELSLSLKEKRTAEIDFDINRKNGHVDWCKIKVSSKRNGSGEIIWTGIAIDITQEVYAREKIKEQEQQLKSLHHYANVGIATMSLTGIVTSINPAVCEITGYTDEDIVGKHFRHAAVFYKNDLAYFGKLFTNALAGKIPKKGIHFEWKHKNGEKRWAEAFLNLIRDKGQITGFQGVFLDVTDRVLLEKERSLKHRDSDFLFNSALGFLKINTEEELYQFLAKQLRKLIPEAIINLNSVNDELTQLKVESVTGMSGPVRSGILKLIGGSLKGKIFEIDQETFSYAKHGKLIQVHDNLYDLAVHQIPKKICTQIEKFIQLRDIHEISIGDGDKIVGGCVIFICKNQKLQNTHLVENLFRQASEAISRMHAHRRLEQREELYRSLAENTEDMILRVNERGELIFANVAFLDIFGLNTADTYLKPLWLQGFPTAICELIQQTIQKTNATQQPQSCNNALFIGDTPRFFEWRMFPENDSKNKSKSVLIFVHDITERKEAEARMMNSIENKSRIFGLIGHDLKNPLNSMLGFLKLMTDRYDDLSDEIRKKYLKYIMDSSQNLNQLLLSLQEWSKADDHQDHYNPLFFDVRQVIDSSLDFIKIGCIEKNLVIQNKVQSGTLIKADYNMIAAALRNILSNACKFSYEGGRIDIEISRNKKEVILEISDYGTGMTEVEIEQLMSLDHTISKAGTRGEIGSGIGFKFAREFIERNSGWIKLKSQPGEGTHVKIGLKTE